MGPRVMGVDSAGATSMPTLRIVHLQLILEAMEMEGRRAGVNTRNHPQLVLAQGGWRCSHGHVYL